MKTLSYKNIAWIFLLVALSFSSSTCNGLKSAVNKTWSLVQLVTVGNPIETSYIETVEIKNCGVHIEKTVSCSAGTSDDLNLALNPGGVFGKKDSTFTISGSVGTTLGINQGSSQGISLPSPPDGFIYVYNVRKVYKIVSGQVLARSSSGDEKTLNYEFSSSCSVDVDGSPEMISCPSQTVTQQQDNSSYKSDLKILSPLEGSEFTTNPTITWKAYPNASRYTIVIYTVTYNQSTGKQNRKLILKQLLDGGLTYTPVDVLSPNNYYIVEVWADTRQYDPIAYGVTSFIINK
jgi:hypothetical protein